MRNKFVSLKNIFTFVSKIYLMTLKEAFSLLITQPLWYKNSDYIRQQAVRDKRLFLVGKSIPEERMREYLRAAGWEQTQEEQWAEKSALTTPAESPNSFGLSVHIHVPIIPIMNRNIQITINKINDLNPVVARSRFVVL